MRRLKADPAQRAAFVERDAALWLAAQAAGARRWFVDEAHVRADADLRLTWGLRGEPALVDSTSPRWGEHVSSAGAVCLETGAVAVMELAGNRTAATSVAVRRRRRAAHAGPLIVIWDTGAAHGGEAMRAHLTTPDLALRLVRLPAYSPDDNAVEHLWAWAREEVTATTCFGTAAAVRAAVGPCFASLAERAAEGTRRCRTALQAEATPLLAELSRMLHVSAHAVPVREFV